MRYRHQRSRSSSLGFVINHDLLIQQIHQTPMRPSVIIIDDDVDLACVLSEFFTLRSINVLAIGHNGKEAVKLYKKYSPDVVVMDYLMPDYDGLYGLRNIKKTNADAKVIMHTGSANAGLFNKFEELGVFTIFQKPQNLKKLVEIINKIPLSNTIQSNKVRIH